MSADREMLPGVTLGPLPALTDADLSTNGYGIYVDHPDGFRLQIGALIENFPNSVLATVMLLPEFGIKAFAQGEFSGTFESMEDACRAAQMFLEGQSTLGDPAKSSSDGS